MDKLVEKVAKAVRRQQFERNRRLNAFDETTQPTGHELSDARAAINVVLEADAQVAESLAVDQFAADAELNSGEEFVVKTITETGAITAKAIAARIRALKESKDNGQERTRRNFTADRRN